MTTNSTNTFATIVGLYFTSVASDADFLVWFIKYIALIKQDSVHVSFCTLWSVTTWSGRCLIQHWHY